MIKIEKISPLGFCPGAKLAIDIFKRNAPLESFGPILHNQSVVTDLEKCGIRVIVFGIIKGDHFKEKRQWKQWQK